MNKVAIITGGSKGIGNALVLKFKTDGFKVISISRNKVNNLEDSEQVICDLSNIDDAENCLNKLLNNLKEIKPQEIILINNAGTLGEINRVENIDSKNIESTVSLNFTAPLILSSQFIKNTKSWSCLRKIINISSGAAVGSYYGWSVYCASKAAMDSFTKVVAVEQESEENPVKIMAIYPGVVDTNMQKLIRTKSKEEFKNVSRFIELKENNELSNPLEVANEIYQISNDKSIVNGAVLDVRNF